MPAENQTAVAINQVPRYLIKRELLTQTDDAQIVRLDQYAPVVEFQHYHEAVVELERVTAERDHLRQEAQIHAMEAKAHRSTVHEIYQLVSDRTGEQGDWNGADPIKALLDARDELWRQRRELDNSLDKLRAENTELLKAHAGQNRIEGNPPGWQLVPVEPTGRQQFYAAFNLCSEFGEIFVRTNEKFALAVYRAMLAAAPAPERQADSRCKNCDGTGDVHRGDV